MLEHTEGDKETGRSLGWRVESTTYPFVSPWLTLRQDRIDIEGRAEIVYTYREGRGAVGIVPITREGMMVMIRQYRYPVDAWCMEIPAGGLHDRVGVALEDVAREELYEEAGATCDELLPVTRFYSASASSNEVTHIYLALGVVVVARPTLEVTEHIEVLQVPVAEGVEMARRGDLMDALSALGILQCEPVLRARGLLEGR